MKMSSKKIMEPSDTDQPPTPEDIINFAKRLQRDYGEFSDLALKLHTAGEN